MPSLFYLLVGLSCATCLHAITNRRAAKRKVSSCEGASPALLCKVQKSGGSTVQVFAKGCHRFLSFGADIQESWQARVRCTNTNCAKYNVTVNDEAKCPPCPCEKPGDIFDDDMYTNVPIFDKVKPVCESATEDQPIDILMVGLGGAALHRQILQKCPKGTRLSTIEYDAPLVGLAQNYFGLEIIPRVSEVHVGDALNTVKKLQVDRKNILSGALGKAGWDAVVVDCFDDDGIPDSCKSIDFLSTVQRLLKRPSGIIVQHVYHDWPGHISQRIEFNQVMANYRAVFGDGDVSITKFPEELSDIESIIVASV
mmetsp:Transcript_90392/g.165821  ORF Transcript_90392/g.165821 Transcript_90392/m.165821 type:complete len:311 (-) Transcript_90392:45-977(-)